ncbi:MAG: DUF6090 family protein [Phaeodactylibacter sp.]|uniref:DUF6090 family protein n=1 Tax=Phaeodactylibacter sp. TaxID=1940289 RepID=UPI0032F03C8F
MKRKYNWLNHVFNFLAVILGVYLAFYMNERAKQNEDRKESMLLMNSLISDLSQDIEKYERYDIPVNIQYQEKVLAVLDLLLADSTEGIGGPLSDIIGIENYAPTTSTYSSMKSSGKLRLIDDLDLRKELTDFYEGFATESEMKGTYQVDYFTDELLLWLTMNVDLVDMQILNKGELVVLRNKLFIYESLISQKVESYKIVVDKSRELKQAIESTLKHQHGLK